MSSLPYHEPSIIQILILSSFLLALNVIDALLDRALYCGLVGQVLIGVAWGAPGGNLLSPDLQDAVVQLGYLGLILIVFEGGASTSVEAVKRNLVLSAVVAVTGVGAPMALNFAVLGTMVGASSIQCFAAGAALCSTSLGTTFAVLSASGLADTRLGSVLGTAAMMDDVLGLVMVQIVSSLGAVAGGGNGEIKIDIGNTVLRPVLVSLGFAIAVPLACRFLLRPALFVMQSRVVSAGGNSDSEDIKSPWWQRGGFIDEKQTALIVQTTLLVALVVAASFAGASVLLAAYLAGIVVAWWGDAQRGNSGQPEEQSLGGSTPASESSEAQQTVESNEESKSTTGDRRASEAAVATDDALTTSQATTPSERQQDQVPRSNGSDIYKIYYSQAVNQILKPFFFASIGFSIPISDMFSGEVVWRGVIYSILMAIGKILCGLWLVRFPVSMGSLAEKFGSFVSSRYRLLFSRFRRHRKSNLPSPKETPAEGPQPGPISQVAENAMSRDGQGVLSPSQEEPREATIPSQSNNASARFGTPAKPLSLYPAAIVSSAMVARGEIGFLISAVAESNGVFRRPSDDASIGASALFLVVTWAIVLCTIIGPICVGVLVRRVKKLEAKAARVRGRGTRDVLGVWGVH
ncbi:Sodium/hydrogen exchanger [Hypoxylon sp. NC0597]|nr:Sodium/hydrogen exchanger [Hypoxylon sp. NC0597]